MRRLAYIVVFCLSIGLNMACAADNPNVKAAKDLYKKQLQKINSDLFGAHLDLNRNYAKTIESLKAAKQKKGDLEGYRAVDSEIKRYKQSKTVTDKDFSSLADLKAIQKRFVETSVAIDKSKNTKIIALTDKYIKHLLAKQKSYTQAGKLDDAIAFNEEQKRIKKSPLYLKAKLAKAADAENEDPSEPSENDKEEPVAKDKVDAEAAAAKQVVPSGFKIYKQNRTTLTSLDKGVVFKPASLRSTGNVKKSHGVSCSLAISKNSTGRRGYYTSGSNTRLMKVTMRSTRSGAEFTDLALVLQYFAKTQGKSAKSQFDAKVLSIAYLGKDPLVIETPPFSFRKSRYYYSYSNSEFYGMVISVIDVKNKTLLYQGMSASGLGEYSKSSVTEVDRIAAKGKVDRLYTAYREARSRYSASGGSTSSSAYRAYSAARSAYYRARSDFRSRFPE